MTRRLRVGLVVLALVSVVGVTWLDVVAALHGAEMHGLIRVWHYLMTVGAIFLVISVVIGARHRWADLLLSSCL